MKRHRSGLRHVVALGAAAALCLATISLAPAAADPATADDDFRVEPYLQNPATDGMLITWMSWHDEPGELQLEGQDPIASSPLLQEALDWTDNNRQQAIDHPEWGDWFQEGRNYRHQVQLTDLEPDTTYTYTVKQGESQVTNTFTTAPTATDWEDIRIVAMSDSETEPEGRTLHREWVPGAIADGSERPSVSDSLWAEQFGTVEQQGEQILRYALTEDEGFAYNMDIVTDRDPDLMMFAGDLVQGGGFQPGWDEWFRYLAGDVGNPASSRPVLPALGNWENFGASDGGYEIPAVINGRESYHSYFTPFPNGTPEHHGNYHRLDYGPLTVITLDSTKGAPDDHPDNYSEDEQLTGTEFEGPGSDTQPNFILDEYHAGGGPEIAPYNQGGAQWNWAQDELADAREQGQIILVQFHHAAYSSGEHGLPMNHEDTSGQGGTPMQIYSEMFEEYGVAAVISGHSEMFERSLVDLNGDGHGINYYDVGIAGDGLRGERRADGNLLSEPILEYNPHRVWSADQFEPEIWDGEVLVDGGKHYGHLEINIERGAENVSMSLTPVYSFPLLDEDLQVHGTERRVYEDEVELTIAADGTVVPDELTPIAAVSDLAEALADYVDNGDVDGPIAHQLQNAVAQAHSHLDTGRMTPAIRAIERFQRHLQNPKRPDTLTEEAAQDLQTRTTHILDLLE